MKCKVVYRQKAQFLYYKGELGFYRKLVNDCLCMSVRLGIIIHIGFFG